MTNSIVKLFALLLVCLLVACGGDAFETTHWVGVGPDAPAGDSSGSDVAEENSVDAGPDAPAEASAGDSAGGDVVDENSVDAGPDATAEASAGDSAGSDVELDAADSGPDSWPDSPEACVPETCAQMGKDCGPVDDGCGTTLNCGSCPTNESCGGGGTPNVCGGCVPIECADVPQSCGLLEDGCGNTVDCGPYTRGHDPSCQSGAYQYKWYCDPETQWAPPPFETGCVEAGWPGSYCCTKDE